MENPDLEVLEAALRRLQAGHKAWLYTVVRTWGSSSRPLGSMMVLGDDGRIEGSVSGGCIEEDLVACVLAQGSSSATSSIVRACKGWGCEFRQASLAYGMTALSVLSIGRRPPADVGPLHLP
ncbi:XdhC family protein [Paraburkholderia hospita]|uniref:XdhC family protein n=1 Tax=Paraburkholderia hospita TaxID=169430 RepID=UPI0009A78D9A